MHHPIRARLPRCLLAACLLAGAPAAAQQKAPAGRKLDCWDQNGQRVCSDTLPPEALDRARDEISAASGLRTGEVARALTDEERALEALEQAQRLADEAAAQTRRRTEQALLSSYPDEDDLRRVFTERTGIIDNNVRMAAYNVASLRQGLLNLLHTAGDQELAGTQVAAAAADGIRARHRELLQQQRMQHNFERQRVELDQEIAETLDRYRELKAAE